MKVEFKKYRKIRGGKLLNIRVIKNNSDILYEGNIEDAPDDILDLYYYKVEIDSHITIYYVYDEEYLKTN